VVDDDRVPVDAEKLREHDHAVVGGGHRRAREARHVETQVVLLVDALPPVDVVSAIGEMGHHLRRTHRLKRTRPEELRRRALGEGDQLRVVDFPEVAIDLKVVRQEVAFVRQLGCLREDRRDHLVEERIIERNRVAMQRPGEELVDHRDR
jgi:hypothetical protein